MARVGTWVADHHQNWAAFIYELAEFAELQPAPCSHSQAAQPHRPGHLAGLCAYFWQWGHGIVNCAEWHLRLKIPDDHDRGDGATAITVGLEIAREVERYSPTTRGSRQRHSQCGQPGPVGDVVTEPLGRADDRPTDAASHAHPCSGKWLPM
jgi:hypothetical protein